MGKAGSVNIIKWSPWVQLWILRSLLYIGLFIAISLIGFSLLKIHNLLPTDIEDARYFLSAMVQAQATIATLIITLTLIAIQMASSSYTPRVVEVMKKNPDMWYLLAIYVYAISIGFVVLKDIGHSQCQYCVSWILILGIFTFSIIFVYMFNTIALLRPDTIVKMLVKEINPFNIHQEKWEDDIMQPVFDVVHASISRFDATTTRTGLKELSNQILSIFSTFNDEEKNKKSEHISAHLCNHIQRSTTIALRNDDEGILREITIVLDNFGTQTAKEGLEDTTLRVAEILGKIGIQVTIHRLQDASLQVVEALQRIGTDSADTALEEVIFRIAWDLGEIWGSTLERGLDLTINRIPKALADIGFHAADKGLEDASSEIIWVLGNITTRATDRKLKDTARTGVMYLSELGKRAANQELESGVLRVTEAFSEIAKHSVDKKIDNLVPIIIKQLGYLKRIADERKLENVTLRITDVLKELEIHSI